MEILYEQAGLAGVRLFEWWSIPRKGWLIILTELCMIIGLVGRVVTEYVNDIYFQGYVNSLAPVIVPMLGVASGIASASAATILYFDMRKSRHAEATDAIVESSGGKIQSDRHVRRSTLSGPKAAKRSTSPHRQATELKQPPGSGEQETVPPIPPEKQEGT